MAEDHDAGDAAETTEAAVASILLLTLLAEVRVAVGLDEDASGVVGRMLALLGSSGELGRVVQAPGMPWSGEAHAVRAALAVKLRRAEPVMCLLAGRGPDPRTQGH